MPIAIDPVSVSGRLRAAQAVSVFVSTAAAAGSLSYTVFLIPRLLESPTGLMLRQWKRAFLAGAALFPAASVVAGAAFVLVDVAVQRSLAASRVLVASPSRLPRVAAALCLGILPYTLAVLGPTNKALLARAAEAEADARVSKADRAAGAGTVYTAADEAAAKQLVDRWGTLNLARPLMLATAAVLGLLTYL